MRDTATTSSLTVSWDESPIGDFRRYEVYHSTAGPFEDTDAMLIGTITDRTTVSLLVDSLVQATDHWFRVVVRDDGDPMLSSVSELLRSGGLDRLAALRTNPDIDK